MELLGAEHSVRPEGSEKTMPNRYRFLTLNVNNYRDKHWKKIYGKCCEMV